MLTDLKMSLKKPNEDFVVLATRNENSPTQRVPTIYELEMENSNERKAPKSDGKEKEEEKKEGLFKKIGKFFTNHPALKVLVILFVCALLFIGAIFGTIKVFNNARPQEVVMPDVSGTKSGSERMTKEDATKALTELGFTAIKYEEVYDEEIEAGLVIKQEPKFQENYKLNVTKEIVLTVSKGQKIVTLPKKIVGKTIEEMRTTLTELELSFEEVEETNEEIEKGIILSVEPEEGLEISASTKVKLTVSAGSQWKDVSVPNVLNKSEEEARTLLAEFKELEVTYTENPDKSDGVVTAQSIQAGKTVKENEKIVITVNKQPRRSNVTVMVNLKSLLKFEKEPVMENTVSTQKVSGKVEILVGSETIYSKENSFEETNISASYTGSGVKDIKVKVDGVTQNIGDKRVDFNQGDQVISIP
jgi:beta-lactam-binding protein with PASTA domain